MRLWSLHPRYLDAQGLVALWREALLAQKVLLGKTRGYTHHPQLARFKETTDPVGAISVYLTHVAEEAERRGYHFDRRKIFKGNFTDKITVTTGQAEFERSHLAAKLKKRSPSLHPRLRNLKKIDLHPEFEMVEGEIEIWEKK